MRKILSLTLIFLLATFGANANPPWDKAECHKTVYNKYIKATTGVHEQLDYNNTMISLLSAVYGPKPDTDEGGAAAAAAPERPAPVVAHEGKFYPLTTYEGLIKASYFTFQGFKNVNIRFDFQDETIGGIVGLYYGDDELKKQAQVAYRDIVPSEFRYTPSIAGPMACNEYIIDANGYEGETSSDADSNTFSTDGSLDDYLKAIVNTNLSFVANKDQRATPLLVNLKDCNDVIIITKGITLERAKQIFFALEGQQLDFVDGEHYHLDGSKFITIKVTRNEQETEATDKQEKKHKN